RRVAGQLSFRRDAVMAPCVTTESFRPHRTRVTARAADARVAWPLGPQGGVGIPRRGDQGTAGRPPIQWGSRGATHTGPECRCHHTFGRPPRAPSRQYTRPTLP